MSGGSGSAAAVGVVALQFQRQKQATIALESGRGKHCGQTAGQMGQQLRFDAMDSRRLLQRLDDVFSHLRLDEATVATTRRHEKIAHHALCCLRRQRTSSRRCCRARPRRSRAGSWHRRSAGSCPPSCGNPSTAGCPMPQLLRRADGRRSVDEKCLRSRISTVVS